jgi:acetyl-CoA carboxylase biotin carboxyl carrier protein
MSLTHEDVAAILKIIDESPYDEIRLEMGDLKVHVRRCGEGERHEAESTDDAMPDFEVQRARPAPASSAAPAPRGNTVAAVPAAEHEPREGLIAVRAPMMGTFYRAASPGEPAFVEVGDKVKADDTLCLVEVMKLFNSVKAGVAGTVIKILAENGSVVQHGQVIVLIESDEYTADSAGQ